MEIFIKDIESIEEVCDGQTPKIINSIEGRYGALRQKSKAPT